MHFTRNSIIVQVLTTNFIKEHYLWPAVFLRITARRTTIRNLSIRDYIVMRTRVFARLSATRCELITILLICFKKNKLLNSNTLRSIKYLFSAI